MTTTTPPSFAQLCALLPDHPYDEDGLLDEDPFAFITLQPSPPPQASADQAGRNARRRAQRAARKEEPDEAKWAPLDRSPRPEHQDCFDTALALARTIPLHQPTPADLPELTGLAGERKAKEGRGGATSIVTTMRLIVRSPYPHVLGSVFPDRTGQRGRPATPAPFWFFYLALARELRSYEQADQEIRAHWDDIVVPEFTAQGVRLRPVGTGAGQTQTANYNGYRKWRARVVDAGLVGPLNVLFTVLSLRLHVALAEALGHTDGGILNPNWWQVPYADSTVMRPPSDVYYHCALCGPDAEGCDHPVDLVKGRGSRAREEGRERVAAQGQTYKAKSHGNKVGMHNIVIAASQSKGARYQRTILAVEVDDEGRDEMSVAMPLLTHFLDLAGTSWIRALAYDGLLKGKHRLFIMRRNGTEVINLLATAGRKDAEGETDTPGTTVRTGGKHKGTRVATHASQQMVIDHRDEFGHPCFHFIVCDDGATYDAPHPLAELKVRKLPKGTLLRPVDYTRTLLPDGFWEFTIEFEIHCRQHTERFAVVLTDSRVDDDGSVPYSEPVQAFRHFCDADPERARTIMGVRSNIEGLFGWLEQRYMHKDRVACWDRESQLLDLVGIGIAANAEVWAHAQRDFADAAR